MKRIFRHILVSLAVMGVALALALVFGGPGEPRPCQASMTPSMASTSPPCRP